MLLTESFVQAVDVDVLSVARPLCPPQLVRNETILVFTGLTSYTVPAIVGRDLSRSSGGYACS